MPDKHQYGPYVRLWGILRSQLPPEGASAQDLTHFIAPILGEAISFVNTVPPATAPDVSSGPWKPKGCRSFAHSDAPVQLYERVVPSAELEAVARDFPVPQLQQQRGSRPRAESWVLRRSVHADAPERGTASWDEWKRYFKEGHAAAELEYTATVLRTELLASWDCAGVEVTLGKTTWAGVTLKLEQSVHRMPAPLKNRVFPVLQVTAEAGDKRIFIVVQIAVVMAGPQQGAGADESGATRGAYTSVEVFISQPELAGVEWIMGTVSDAGGLVPAWVQKMAVPGRVAKDVDMFLEWVDRERKKTNGA
ncbi:hypothetical protein ESCO_004751 [Escovopsis weberi]|uniref:DUF3074 domain-containing protein n=1 Tax=Escovopsis weberi TaxID=150374 RepID=A0A0M8MRC8_ESCWE|nr:hypothetical protein ESCO_004751 [Escovopsis weberi]